MGRIETDSRDDRRNEALRLFDEFMVDPPTANVMSDVFNRKDMNCPPGVKLRPRITQDPPMRRLVKGSPRIIDRYKSKTKMGDLPKGYYRHSEPKQE